MIDPDPLGSSGRLAENIVHFGRLLRRAGLPVGTGRVLDALEAVQAGCLRNREDFYWALNAVLISRRDQHEVFDQAFHAFWRAPKMQEQLMALLLQQIARKASPEKRQAAARRLADAMFDEDHTYAARQDGRELELDASFSASIQETLRRKDFEQMSAAEQDQARAAIAVMRLNRVSRPTRRFSQRHGGARLDPRKTMRNTMRAGGQLVQLAWRDRATRLPPLVILCDISGSMSGYSRIVLHFLHALMSDRDRVHVFLFGTRLTNITKELQRRDVDEALDRVSGAVADWSGGTRIGAALHEFNFHWARRVMGQSAHILIITDGLEREDACLMEMEMARLRRQAKRIIWLNPLLRFDRFEARASGIRAMLPYVDEFRPAHNLLSLEQLAEALFTGTGAEHDPQRWLRDT